MWKSWKTRQALALAKGVTAFPRPDAKSSRQTDAVSMRTGHDPPTARGATGRSDERNRFAEAVSAVKLSKKSMSRLKAIRRKA